MRRALRQIIAILALPLLPAVATGLLQSAQAIVAIG